MPKTTGFLSKMLDRLGIDSASRTNTDRNTFSANGCFSLDQLCELCEKSAYKACTRPAMMNQLGEALARGISNVQQRTKVMALLAMHMSNEDSVHFHGAPRQANFFANYAVDLMFSELDAAPNLPMETLLRQVMNHWVNTLVPAQDTFNITGIVYTRQEVRNMLAQGNFYSHRANANNDEIVQHVGGLLGGKGGEQNVHSVHVRAAGEVILERLKQAGAGSTVKTAKQALYSLKQSFEALQISKDLRKDAIEGAERMSVITQTDTCWSVKTSPAEIVTLLTRYINNHPEPATKNALLESFAVRLQDIIKERPCITGKLQMLLDVPSAIDPALSLGGRKLQVADDMQRLAARVNEQLTSLVDEDEQRAKAQGLVHNPLVTSRLGQEMFEARTVADMTRLYGVTEAEFRPELNKHKAGF